MGNSNSLYNNARKHLNYLLEQNEIIQVNSVDELGASNFDPMDDAIRLLKKSLICVFIFDNSEEISDKVLEEHRCAKENGISRLYYFCKAESTHNTVTALRKELEIDDRNGERTGRLYDEENCFTDIVLKAYTNVLEEIAKGYNDIKELERQSKLQHQLSIAGAAEISIASMGDV